MGGVCIGVVCVCIGVCVCVCVVECQPSPPSPPPPLPASANLADLPEEDFLDLEAEAGAPSPTGGARGPGWGNNRPESAASQMSHDSHYKDMPDEVSGA